MGLFDEIFTDTSDTSDTSIRDCARYKKYFFEKGKKENSEYHESRGEVSEVSEMSETSNPIFPSETSPDAGESDHKSEILAELSNPLSPPSPASPSCPEQGSKQATLPEAPQTGLKPQDPGQSDIVAWDSPLFGRLEAPVLEMREHTFVLKHPLTHETVELSRDWLVSLDERSAILEFDAGLPREEADDQAQREFFGLFRKGGRK